MGWSITSVNYDKPDYVEYEIVKGDQTTKCRSTSIKIVTKQPKSTWRQMFGRPTRRNRLSKTAKSRLSEPNNLESNPYSERDRMKSSKNQKERLEQALKTGEEKIFIDVS